MEFTIKDATPEDASLISIAILTAIGEELTMNMAGDKNREEVERLFEELARRENTQYSYLNTRIAATDNDEPVGVCISYDGKNLKKLRREFFKSAKIILGWEITDEEIEALPGETDENEFYLDTLMTLPAYRGKGIGEALIKDAGIKAKKSGKPLGLLCDYDNHKAQKLYNKIGFVKIGDRPFAGHLMHHYSKRIV